MRRLPAFCPASQVDLRYVENLGDMLGRPLSFRITKLEGGRGKPNLVLSRRAVLEEEARSRPAAARERLKPGSVVTGKVSSLAAYGAFVDLGGVEGMLHVSEISDARLGHPQEMLAVGQEIEVQILRIEPGKDGRDRIALSRKALEASPWQGVEARFTVGMEITGRVKRLETFFLDEALDDLYRSEERVGAIIRSFSLLAVVVSCLGLFGLASFTAERRTKEIGIRKVLGASVPAIALLFSREFSRWVLAANVIAWPAAYLAVSKWLERYPYRIAIGPGPFLFAGGMALLVAFLTVGYHSVRASRSSPAGALKYE